MTENKKEGKDLLEIISWIASILSLLLGILVWILPSPNSLILLFSNSSSFGFWHFFETVLFSLLVGFGLSTVAKLRYKKALREGKGTKKPPPPKGSRFEVYVEGNWIKTYQIIWGFGLIGVSTLLALLAAILEIIKINIPVSLTIWLFLTLGIGAIIVLRESKDFVNGIQGKVFFEGARNDVVYLIISSLVTMLVFVLTIIVVLAKVLLP